MPSLALAPPPRRAAARLALFLLCVVGCTTAAVARDGQVNLFTDGSSTMVIDQPGSYVLVADVQMTGDQVGLRVDASDVTIDLNGHTLRGTSPLTAIGVEVMAGRGNVALRNGVVANFGYGVRGREQTTIEDVRFADTGFYAVIGGRANVVARCTVTRAGSAADGAADPLGTPPGTLFRAGIAVGERSLVERCVVGQVGSESATADVVGIIAGGASRVAGNVVDNLDAAGGWMSGIRAEADSLVAENVVRDLAASSGRVDGIAAGERSTLRGNRVSGLTGLHVHGVAGRDVAAGGEFLAAIGLTIDGCAIDGLTGAGVNGSVFGVRAGEEGTVTRASVHGLSATASPACGISLRESSSVADCHVANVRGSGVAEGISGAQGIVVTTYGAIRGCAVAELRGTATSECAGLLLGDNSSVVDSSVHTMEGDATGGGAGVRGGFNVRVAGVTVTNLFGVGGWVGVQVGERGVVEDVVVTEMSSESDLHGVSAGPLSTVSRTRVSGVVALGASQVRGIAVGEHSRVAGCGVHFLRGVPAFLAGISAAGGARLEGNDLALFDPDSGETVFAIEAAEDARITGNTIRNIGTNANLNSIAISARFNVVVSGNQIEGITGARPVGVRVFSPGAGTGSPVANVIRDNIITNLLAGVNAEGQGAAIEVDLPATIEANVIEGLDVRPDTTGMSKLAAIRATPDVTIRGNTIRSVRGRSDALATGRPYGAIEISEEFGGLPDGRAVIADNVLHDIADYDSQATGIYLHARGATVSGNVISDMGVAAIYLQRFGPDFDAHHFITGNRINRCNYAVFYDGARFNRVAGNDVTVDGALSAAGNGVTVNDSTEEGNRVYLF